MALVALDVPKIGLVMENARLVRWLKAVGDRVVQGEPLLELETEKSVVEVESTESGRLVELLVQVDQEVRVGERIAWLETASPGARDPISTAPSSAVPTNAPSPPRPPPASAGSAASLKSLPQPAPGSAAAAARAAPVAAGTPDRIVSSPAARRLAAQRGVELGDIAATGPGGRIQLADVERVIDARPGVAGAAAAPVTAARQPLSSMRRAMARAMTLSNATVPQFRVEHAVDWTSVRAVRAALDGAATAAGVKSSVNDFLLQAIARALLAHPALNATFCGDADAADAALVPATGVHIGLVVAVAGGVLVPVIHDVEQHSIPELARRRTDAVERARQGTLKRGELEGATISLSNLGASGPDRFDAIISPPQSAILAVGRRRDTVVARNGRVEIRPCSNLSLTVDHRVADGRVAADFLRGLVDILEGDAWRLS